jgi:hypothetical protein
MRFFYIDTVSLEEGFNVYNIHNIEEGLDGPAVRALSVLSRKLSNVRKD